MAKKKKKYLFPKEMSKGKRIKINGFFTDMFNTGEIESSYWNHYDLPKHKGVMRGRIINTICGKQFLETVFLNDLEDKLWEIIDNSVKYFKTKKDKIKTSIQELELGNDNKTIKAIALQSRTEIRPGRNNFSDRKEDIKNHVANSMEEIMNKTSPTIASEYKYDSNTIAASKVLVQMIENETDIKQHFYNMFMAFNRFVMIKKPKLAMEITEVQQGFLEIVNQSTSLEHLQFILETLNKE